MPIASGVLVAVSSDREDSLVERLKQHEAIDVSGVGPKGIAIVLERSTMQEMTNLTKELAAWEDVRELQMTYGNWKIRSDKGG